MLTSLNSFTAALKLKRLNYNRQIKYVIVNSSSTIRIWIVSSSLFHVLLYIIILRQCHHLMLNVHLKLHDKHSVSLYLDLSEEMVFKLWTTLPCIYIYYSLITLNQVIHPQNLASPLQHTYNLMPLLTFCHLVIHMGTVLPHLSKRSSRLLSNQFWGTGWSQSGCLSEHPQAESVCSS